MREDAYDFAGKANFIWWVGVVEDRKDPLKLGRCRVRCIGWHSANKMQLPTNMLPWAMPNIPINVANVYAPKEGDMVFGFFVDGENAQELVMLGSFPSIPLNPPNRQDAFTDPREDSELSSAPRPPKSKSYDTDGSGIKITEQDKASLYPNKLDEPTTSRLARNDEKMSETFIQERKNNVVQSVPTYNGTWTEPTTQYAAKYPYNNVTETESGHIMEFDDTYGKERIHLAHRNGSFQEWFPSGDKVEKITKDNYQIVMGNDRVYIMGKCFVTVQGDAEVYVKENAYVKVDKNVTATIGQNMTATIGENLTGTVGGNATLNIDGNFSADIGGTCSMTSAGNMSFTAPRIDMN